jgi:hypothetical protein
MRSQKLWCVLVFCCLGANSQRVSAQHHVDYMRAPDTIKGLFDVSDVVVFAQITGRKVLSEGNNSEATDYPVIILERFKGPVKDHGPGLTVRRGGGVDKATSEVGFPAFEAGDKYVLFLKDGGAGQFVPAYGPDGAVLVSPSGEVKTVGRQEVTLKFRGYRSDALLAELRRLSMGGQ